MSDHALARGIERGAQLLRQQAARGAIDRWWEVELCEWLEVPLPDEMMDRFEQLIVGATASTPYFDGDGPWDSTNRGRALYAIEHTRNVIAIGMTLQLLGGDRRKALIAWLRSLVGADGRVDTQSELERIEALRRPDAVAQARQRIAAAWRRAVPSRDHAHAPGPHSALEDAWHLTDALRRLRTEPASLAAWVQSRQASDGAFRAPITLWPTSERYGTSLADTHSALQTLAALGGSPRDSEACISWLLEQADRVFPTDIVEWYRWIHALVLLGARDRIDPEIMLLVSELDLEPDPEASRVSFETYAAVRIVQLLRHEDES